jgi:3-mercaptopyruvate sulfurtransferase SseA
MTFVSDNLLLFGALLVVLVLLIRAELDHQLNKGLLLSPSAAVRLINNSSDAIIIDTRSTAEFKKGHIKGAKNLPLANFGYKLGELGQQKDCPVLFTVIQAPQQPKRSGH